MLRRINFGQSNFVSTITLAAALNADLRRNCGEEKERKKRERMCFQCHLCEAKFESNRFLNFTIKKWK
jgi:hypothetical protein